MTMSNYSTWAVDENGQPCRELVVTPTGVTAMIYKNWVSIDDPRAWRTDGRYVRPTVMMVERGQLTYQDLWLLVLRGPQYGAYVVAYFLEEGKTRGFAGCGIIITRNRPTVTQESLLWFKKKLCTDAFDVPDTFKTFDTRLTRRCSDL